MRLLTKAILFIFFSCFPCYGQLTNLKFENYDTANGISSSTCLEIFQDKEGFLWFGTIDGLNKFDGYDFEIFRPSLTDRNAISNNRINVITEDNRGRLWIGTGSGLNIYDKQQQRFYKVSFSADKSYREIINCLLFSKQDNSLYIGTKNGLIKLRLNGSLAEIAQHPDFERFRKSAKDKSTDNENITNIVKDNSDSIWFVTDGGYLNCFDISKKNISKYAIDIEGGGFLGHLPKQLLIDGEGNLLIGNDLSRMYVFDTQKHISTKISCTSKSMPVFHILKDKNGIIWASTDGYGIYLLDSKGSVIQHIQHDNDDPFSLPNNQPSKILQDKDGIYWIASYNKGVNKLAISKSVFGHYYYKYGESSGLSTKIAQAVTQTRDGKIWIGTDGGGLNLFDEKNKRFSYFRATPGSSTSLSSDKILYLKEGQNNTLYIGTWDRGLTEFNTVSHISTAYKHDPNNPYSLGQNTVWCIENDKQGRVWLGTSSAGLNLFDPKTKRFYSYKNIPGNSNSLTNNFVFSLYADSKNRLFIGTAQGICYTVLTKDTAMPPKLVFKPLEVKNISENRVNFITEDQLHNIWIGTDVGLYELYPDLKFKKAFSVANGLPNNFIVGIQEDNQHRIWITSKSGLSVLEANGKITNFNIHDGLQGTEYQSKSIFKTIDGRIIAGGINGFNIFNPADIKQESIKLKPYLTELRLFNKKVNAGDTINNRIILQQAISALKAIELKYNEGYLNIGFVALNYNNQERVQYAYRMLGLHENFIEPGSERMATYSSLPPGNYTFEVLASEDGNWAKAGKTALQLTILPPPWKTWWAYTLYGIIVIAGLWFGMRYYTRKVQEEKEHELDQMKLRFFINVSHEFRTPLTLILNPVDRILSSYNDPEQVKNAAQLIQRSSRRLLYLVNQLLDFRKVDLGEAALELQRVNVEKFTKDIFKLFEDLAKTKGLNVVFTSTIKNRVGLLDPDKLEKILTNLLSNAIKFTPSGGTVTVTLEVVEENRNSVVLKAKDAGGFVKITVSDTGIGFKQEHLKDVFRRFFHADAGMAGTGIGLNYTKALVELHKGKISVSSTEGLGSTFTILLPLNLKPSKKAAGVTDVLDYAIDTNPIKSVEYEIAISNEEKSQAGDDELPTSETNRPVVVIVEDNKELRTHLKNELAGQFKVKEASNGLLGLEMIKKYYPDIVISDVMMPQMDGFEMCRQLKNTLEVSHIPVILLTARSLEEDRIEGYDTGADEYLPKPFNINVLKARINNLLEARKRSRERFVNLGGVMPATKVSTNTVDEIFLDKATKVVLDNITNVDFSLEDVIGEMGMGRSQFYRKINAMTGQNPSNFIRTIKLKHAAELLLTKQHSVKEITHMCGFNSSAYFTKTFKELFGKTPTQYIDEAGGEST
ncbi:response regulator [Flavobacterium sp. Sd200]|uniref:hybrid sensor histidine kinase/response regulator transcription factor n=1 Tax=Flavobacterium sp. Sd200 TaxID=2692211 RepID=UPI00136A1D4D|nr:two-component regulator propeller domain-containing protein [Flavobacterium sp. Sd200]MXN90771.1 response regulator [Flavobacterium sp. Sd200]